MPFHTRRAGVYPPRPGLVEGHYGESRSLRKATILDPRAAVLRSRHDP